MTYFWIASTIIVITCLLVIVQQLSEIRKSFSTPWTHIG